MKKTRKSKNIIYFFLLGLLLVIANIYLIVQNRKTFQILEEKPYDIIVANISTNQAEVYWKTKTKNIEVLTYKEKESTAPYKYENDFRIYTNISDEEDLYKSTISNLKPNTEYTFRINSPQHIWDYNLTFITKNINEQVKLPQIETGSSDPGDFILIDAEGEKYMVFANKNRNWALDLKGKTYKEIKYAQYIPKFELKRKLNTALKNNVYAATGANCMTNVVIKDTRYLPTLEQSLALTEGERFSYCKGDYLRECYADAYCKSINAGLNPAISLTVWMHESAASMYAQFPVVEDFGIHVAEWKNDFTTQINYFLKNVAIESYADDWFEEACRRRGEKSDQEIDILKKKYSPEHIWATKYWKGYVCTEDNDGIGAGVEYIGYLEWMFYQMTGKELPKWPWRIPPNANSCDRSKETQNRKYRTCSGESTDSTPTDPDKPIPSGGDGIKDEMVVTDKDRYCADHDGCICLYDKEGNNYKTRLEAEHGYTCTVDKKIIKTEKICCFEDNKLSVKMPSDCNGVLREDIPITNCKNTNAKYQLKKGVSFINPVEVLDTTQTLHPKTAYDLINMSDKRAIAVGEYKSGEWIQVVKYQDGKIYGNDFELDSNKSYMVISLQEAEFNLTGYRGASLDISKLSGWNLVPSYLFDNKGYTSYEILKNLEFNKIKQIGQWQDSKSLFEYTIKNDKNEIYGEELKIGNQNGIFIKVIQ